jgi:DNA-binding GntR family transcriptional regulator
MQRLAAERLLHHQSGGGFEIPHFEAGALENLYAWHQDVVRLALRHRDPDADVEDLLPRLLALRDEDPEAIVLATSELFAVVGRSSRNGEHGAAIEAIGSRLYLARLHEAGLGERPRELVAVWNAVTGGPVSTAIEAIRAYHRRRLRRVPAIVRAIYVP